MSEKKDPCERYCSSCAWPVECAADEACRRREAGEVRSPYPGSDSPTLTAVGKPVFIGVDLASGPDTASEFRICIYDLPASAFRLDIGEIVGEYRFGPAETERVRAFFAPSGPTETGEG